MCSAIICFLVCDDINFEIDLSFLSSRVPIWTKIQHKNVSFERAKRAFNIKKALSEIVSDQGVGL